MECTERRSRDKKRQTKRQRRTFDYEDEDEKICAGGEDFEGNLDVPGRLLFLLLSGFALA